MKGGVLNMMKFQKIAMFMFLMTISFAPIFVEAIEIDKRLGIGETNPGIGTKEDDVAKIIGYVITFLLKFIGALSVLVIVFAGLFYILSGGDSSKTDEAKNWLLYAIIGLIIALLGWVIVNTVITKFVG